MNSNFTNQSTDLPDDVVLSVRNVSKKFCRNLKRSMLYGMQDLAKNMFGLMSAGGQRVSAIDGDPEIFNGKGPSSPIFSDLLVSPISSRQVSLPPVQALRQAEFWALQDISFDLKRGECLGLIGRNGSGKSTLLRILYGIYPPDAGEVAIRGRLGAFIALGAGFHPHMTGRENVYLNGVILGVSQRKINALLDSIIEFAEIGEFIDAPVASYSSGMTVRLGFAIATAVKPDILILDEILAVGDAAFRAKCYNRIGEIQRASAVIYVSHSMPQVAQMSTKVLLLNKGKTQWFGDVGGGVTKYEENSAQSLGGGEAFFKMEYPVQAAYLTFSPESLEPGGFLTAQLDLTLAAPMPSSSIRITFYNPEGLFAAEWNSKRANVEINLPSGGSSLEIRIGPIHLRQNLYKLALTLNDYTGVYAALWSLKQHSLAVRGSVGGLCEYQLPHKSIIQNIGSCKHYDELK